MVILFALGFVLEKTDRGRVMRPVRSLADKIGITIPLPTLTPEEMREANEMAQVWRKDALKKYPTLAISSHTVPDDENGFLMLYQLDATMEISSEFEDALPMTGSDYDPVKANRFLEEHQEIVTHIEKIAALPTRSSINMPDDYEGFIGARKILKASKILMLRACLAADDGRVDEALHDIRRAGKIVNHLRDIETPFLLSEAVAITVELSRQTIVLEEVLPKLGPQTDLTPWLVEMDCANSFNNRRLAVLMRGEWHTSGRYMGYPLIAQMDLMGQLADGKASAMAYAEWTVKETRRANAAKPFEIIPELDPKMAFSHLDRETRDLISMMNFGTNQWTKGMQRSAVVVARNVAAIELLMLEQSGTVLSEDSTQQVTVDPITNRPFLFDPATREVGIADSVVCTNEEPVKLPW